MYIGKYWGNFIGGSDDSLNLVAFLEDQKKEEVVIRDQSINLSDLCMSSNIGSGELVVGKHEACGRRERCYASIA